MEIVIDNREKRRNYDDFVPSKEIWERERERERERNLHQPQESVFWSQSCLMYFVKKGKCFLRIIKGKHFSCIKANFSFD